MQLDALIYNNLSDFILSHPLCLCESFFLFIRGVLATSLQGSVVRLILRIFGRVHWVVRVVLLA